MAFYKIELIVQSLYDNPTPTQVGNDIASKVENSFTDLTVVCFKAVEMSDN